MVAGSCSEIDKERHHIDRAVGQLQARVRTVYRALTWATDIEGKIMTEKEIQMRRNRGKEMRFRWR